LAPPGSVSSRAVMTRGDEDQEGGRPRDYQGQRRFWVFYSVFICGRDDLVCCPVHDPSTDRCRGTLVRLGNIAGGIHDEEEPASIVKIV
jgi:hypothetical protein